jgi:hypothetical protein
MTQKVCVYTREKRVHFANLLLLLPFLTFCVAMLMPISLMLSFFSSSFSDALKPLHPFSVSSSPLRDIRFLYIPKKKKNLTGV